MITNIKKPYTFSSSENPIIWGFRSDDASSGVIIVRILNARKWYTNLIGITSLPIMYETKIYATEFNNDSTKDYYFDLQPQLNSLTRFRVDNNNDYIVGKQDNSYIYIVSVNEYKKVNGVWQETLDTYYSSPFVVYNAKNDNFQYRYNSLRRYSTISLSDKDKVKYLMGGNNVLGSFLTNRPRPFKINKFSTNQLWFLNNYYYCYPNATGCSSNMLVKVTDANTNNLISSQEINSYLPAEEIRAIATINIFFPKVLNNPLAIVKVNDPINGLTTLYSGTTYGNVGFDTYASNIVNGINNSGTGYEAYVLAKNLVITARPGLYATINGNLAYFTGNTIDISGNKITVTKTGTFIGGGITTKINTPVTRLQLASDKITNSDTTPLDFNVSEGQDFCVQLYGLNGGKLNQTYPVDRPWRLYYTTSGLTTEAKIKLDGNNFTTTKIYLNRTSYNRIFNDFWDHYERMVTGDTITISLNSSTYGIYQLNSKSILGDSITLNVTKISSTGTYSSANQPAFIGYTPSGTTIPNYPISGTTTEISEKVCFKWEPIDCSYEYVNILFANSLGGVDTIQMINPREKRNYKTNIFNQDKKILNNPKHLEQSYYKEFSPTGDYVVREYSNIIPDQVILNNTETVQVELTTLRLTDAESQWLSELVQSKDIYICYGNGGNSTIVPVQLVETTYQVKSKKRLTNQFIEYDFTFEFPRNYKDFIYKIAESDTPPPSIRRCTINITNNDPYGGNGGYFQLVWTYDNTVTCPVTYTLNSLIINGVDYSNGETLTVNDESEATVATGLDGRTYYTNVVDWLNPIIPTSTNLVFYDDMNTYDCPITTNFEIIIQRDTIGFTALYKYDNTGFYVYYGGTWNPIGDSYYDTCTIL